MKKNRHHSGYVLMIGLLVSLIVLLPALFFFQLNSRRQMLSNKKILRIRESQEFTRNRVIEALNSAQSDFYQDHYAFPTSSSYGVSREKKSRYFSCDSSQYRDFNNDFYSGGGSKHLSAVFLYRNDVFRFGLVVENGLTIDDHSLLAHSTIDGGAYFGGDVDLTGSHISFSSRPILVKGNIIGDPNTLLLAGTTMYYSGTLTTNGGQYLGNTYAGIPPMDLLPITLDVYKTKFRGWTDVTSQAVKSATWTFTQSGGECRCVYGNNSDDFWPATYQNELGWPIFVLEGGNLYLKGQCSAKVTVVSYSSSGSNDEGNVIVIDDFGQTPGATVSTSSSTFAVLASRRIIFSKGGTQDVYGYYYAQNFEVAENLAGISTQVTLHGTLHATLGLVPANAGNSLRILFDPSLSVNVPPGIPEKPILVTFRQGKN